MPAKVMSELPLMSTELIVIHSSQFTIWYDEAVAAGLPEPEAMTLSTATLEGQPSARIVLLRGYDERGFCFFSNYSSQKGQELAANPYAAVTFHWVELERQVRIVGSGRESNRSVGERCLFPKPAQPVANRCLEFATEQCYFESGRT